MRFYSGYLFISLTIYHLKALYNAPFAYRNDRVAAEGGEGGRGREGGRKGGREEGREGGKRGDIREAVNDRE